MSVKKAVAKKPEPKKAKASKGVTKKAVAKKTIPVRSKDGKKLAGSVSLGGKASPTAKKATPNVSTPVKSTKKAATSKTLKEVKESLPASRYPLDKVDYNLPYKKPKGFKGISLFGFAKGETVDKFANILLQLDDATLNKLSKFLTSQEKHPYGDYSAYFDRIWEMAGNMTSLRYLPEKHQEDILNYYNNNANSGLPLSEDKRLKLEDLTELERWEVDWAAKRETILPTALSAKEKNVYSIAIEYASHVDLAVRMRIGDEISSQEIYNGVTTFWRENVGAVHPEDKDIFIGA